MLINHTRFIIETSCEHRKRKQKSKKIPFNPALGAASFGNPAFEEDEAEQSRRGFVQENEYGDRQTYDVGVSDYAMVVDENNRDPPDGKDSSGAKADGTEDATYAVVNKNRQGSVTSFKPDDQRVNHATIPQHQNNGINNVYEGNSNSPLVNENVYGDAYYTDPTNQLATPL